MEKSIAVVLVVVAAFVAGRFSRQLPVEAQGGGEPAASCGDVDGEVGVSLNDAIYLLNWLFLGGPEPECPEPRGVWLPDTGQTICYDGLGEEVPCDSDMCSGQDGFYQTRCPSESRFQDNGDDTVTDTCTRLMWQQDTADVNDDGEISGERDGGDRVPWCEALDYCENLVLAGHDDWRLPNVRELQSIIDYGNSDPAIDPIFGALPAFYWSSTPTVSNPDRAWYVLFSVGFVDFAFGNDNHIRAVRTIQPGE